MPSPTTRNRTGTPLTRSVLSNTDDGGAGAGPLRVEAGTALAVTTKESGMNDMVSFRRVLKKDRYILDEARKCRPENLKDYLQTQFSIYAIPRGCRHGDLMVKVHVGEGLA